MFIDKHFSFPVIQVIHFEIWRKSAFECIRIEWREFGKNLRQNKLFNWKVVSCIFLLLFKCTPFHKKLPSINFWNAKGLNFYFVCFIECVQMRAHRAVPPLAISSQLLLQSKAYWLHCALIVVWHTYPMLSLAVDNADAATYQTI